MRSRHGLPEFGTVSLEELANYRGRFGLGIDATFTSRLARQSRFTLKPQEKPHLFHHAWSRASLSGRHNAARGASRLRPK
jgi:hypothetical protein